MNASILKHSTLHVLDSPIKLASILTIYVFRSHQPVTPVYSCPIKLLAALPSQQLVTLYITVWLQDTFGSY